MVNFSTPPPGLPGTAPVMNQAPPQYDPSVPNAAQVNRVNAMNATMETTEAPVLTDPNQVQQAEAAMVAEKQSEKKPFIGAINPYGGWNMQNASTALGAFIDAKNPLGIIGSAGKILLEGTRNAMAGAAANKMYREGVNEYETKLEERERRAGISYGQKGGITGEMLTGNFIEGNDNHSNPNTEVERGEYLQTPDGSTMEVMGKRHSEGGELLNLPGGTKVISDYLKIGAKLATFFKKEFDLNVRASSTFATVLDKYKKKIGLTELLEDEAKLMEKLKDQEDIEFEGTKEINLQVLSEKINELQPEKKELESRFENFTNVVFDKQEATKQPGEKNFEKQEGGEVEQPTIDENGQPIPQEPQQDQGSDIEQLILMYAEITGQDPQQIVAQLQQLPDDQIEQAIAQLQQVVEQAMSQQGQPQQGQPQQGQEVPAGQFQSGGITVDEYDKYKANYKSTPTYEYGNLDEQRKTLIEFLERNNIPYNEEDLKTQKGMDKLAGLAQQAFRNNYKGVSDHYSSMVASTQTGLQTALDNKLVTEDELVKLGVKVSKGKILRGSQGIVPKGNERKVVDLIATRGKDNPEAYKKYVDTNFVDNKWFYRNANIQTVNFDTQEQLDGYVKDNNLKFDENGKAIYYSGTEGLYFTPVLKNKPGEIATPSPEAVVEAQKNSDIKPFEKPKENFENSLPMLTPDQSNLRPNLLQPGLRTFTHTQANAIAVSPEETLKELNKQYNTASTIAAQTNPYTSGAMQADLQAKSNDAINQAYSQAALTNAQDQRNVENINEQRIQQRENSNIAAMNQYEQLAQTALGNYDKEWKSFYENQNLQNVNNWNLENQRQAFNATNDNFKIGAMGWYQTNDTPVIHLDNSGKSWMKNPQTGAYEEVKVVTDPDGKVTKTEKSGTKPVKGRKGGLLLSKGITTYLK